MLGYFSPREKEKHREKLLDWLSGALPCSSAQRAFLPAFKKPAENTLEE